MKYGITLLLALICISCGDDDKQQQIDFTVQNETEITTYISDNNLNAQKSNSGLYYVIDTPGTGAQPNTNSSVTVAYKGYYTNKAVFDESNAEGISFGLQQVIQGWTEGITYFKEGGSGILLVPSHLGYGSFGRGSIPGGAVLIFDVTLISVN